MSHAANAFEPVVVEGAAGGAPIVFVCEHASADMPARFGDLGISAETRNSHAAWDPGALDVARRLARRFDAPLVYGGVSRLLYDCNRSPDARDAIPPRSERHVIPGNADLSAEERERRIAEIYRPFCRALESKIETRAPKAIVTVHSFTPVYFGEQRSVEIGLLHDRDSRLADAMLARAPASGPRMRRNEPYGPGDGVMHTLRTHAEARGLLNVMIEIRNDLIAKREDQAAVAAGLGDLLEAAFADCAIDVSEVS